MFYTYLHKEVQVHIKVRFTQLYSEAKNIYRQAYIFFILTPNP